MYIYIVYLWRAIFLFFFPFFFFIFYPFYE